MTLSYAGRRSGGRIVRALALVEMLEPRRLLSTSYYISPGGNDSNPGTSPNLPWQTLNRANNHSFQPGDQILLHGGNTFGGGLYLTTDDVSTPQNPIVITSYGRGRAVIHNTTGTTAIYIHNKGAVQISKLRVVGSGSLNATNNGIMFYVDQPNTKYDHVRIDDVDVYGFRYGIAIGGGNGTAGFRDVYVTNSYVHHNARAGLFTFGPTVGVNHKVYLFNVHAYENSGVPGDTGVTGHGILIGSANGATVEYSIAHSNGALGNGGAGIWAYDSTKVLFQHNISHSNRTGGPHDGDGFDFDQNTSWSVMQYNYSYNNDGSGFLMATKFNNNLHTNNTIRYNISVNDNRKLDYGSLHIWGKVQNADFHNNTVFLTPRPGSSASRYGIKILNDSIPTHAVNNVNFRNNIIVTTGRMPLLYVSPDQLANGQGLRFQGNAWFSGKHAFRIFYNDVLYSSIKQWRPGTGQETLNGANVGFQGNPFLIGLGTMPLITDPKLLPTMTAYKLHADSPLRDTAINLMSTFGFNPGPRDFWGTPVPQNSKFDFGAHEYV